MTATSPDAEKQPLLSAAQIAAAVRRGELRAADAVEATFSRIAQVEARDNAFISLLHDAAAKEAELIDASPSKDPRLPLLGVPVAVKDVFDVAGVPTTSGSALLADSVAARDSLVVERLRGAGAVIVGKTNMDEFAFSPNQHAFGRTNCPSDPERFAGGSSAGSAAAVANGSVRIAIGSDAGGSVRYPAAVCGVVGYKPTFDGLGPGLQGAVPEFPSLDHLGLLGRTVGDVITLRSAFVDPQSVNRPSAPILGVMTGWREPCTDPVVESLDWALHQLEDSGWTIVELDSIDFDAAFQTLLTTVALEAHRSLAARFSPAEIATIAPPIRALLDHGAQLTTAEYEIAQDARRRLADEIDSRLAGCTALALPANAKHALRWDDPQLTDWSIARFLPPFNLTGHPAISVPIPRSGLPVGIQLVGARGRDDQLLDLATAVEHSFG